MNVARDCETDKRTRPKVIVKRVEGGKRNTNALRTKTHTLKEKKKRQTRPRKFPRSVSLGVTSSRKSLFSEDYVSEKTLLVEEASRRGGGGGCGSISKTTLCKKLEKR